MSFERAKRRGLIAAVLVVAWVGAAPARAASPADRAAARQHWNQAEELKKKGKLAEACKHLEEVERLDPKLPTLMELAECSERLGDLVAAQAQWSVARDRAKHDEKPQSRARAEARLASIEKRVARLTLQLASAPAGAQVLRDDVPLEPASLAGALPMNPGDHVIVVRLAGHDDAKYAVKLAPGDNQTLAIAPGPATTAQSASSPPPSPPAPAAPAAPLAPASTLPATNAAEPSKQAAQPPTGWWSGQRTAGVIFGAAGIVAIGAGSALCIVGKNDDRQLVLGAISLASGGVLLLSGAVLLASAPSSDETPPQARITIMPTLLVARSGTMLGAAGAF
jgi:hypothetical protein